MPSLEPPSILVIRRRYLGDIVLLGSLFRNLRLHWPQARLTALVEPSYAEVLALNPDVDAVLPLPRSGAGLGSWWRALRALRRGRFTHVSIWITFPRPRCWPAGRVRLCAPGCSTSCPTG